MARHGFVAGGVMDDLVEWLQARTDPCGGVVPDWMPVEYARSRAEAHGSIVRWCSEILSGHDVSRYGEFGGLSDLSADQAMTVTLAVETLRWLAYGYRAEAPGWRPEWAPEGVTV